jgi:electron transfer flavoprotein alpha subunit
MEKILFLTHTQEDGSLPKVAFETLQLAIENAKALSANIIVGLIGKNAQAAANQMGGCGAQKFLTVSAAAFESARYGSDVAAIEAIVKASGATLVIASATSRLNRAIPGAAVRVHGAVDTHVTALTSSGGKIEAQRWYYRQRMVATLTRAVRPWFLLVESGVTTAWSGSPSAVKTEEVAVPANEKWNRTKVVGVQAASQDAQTIRPDAKLLFVAGAGWCKKQGDGQIHAKDAHNLILGFLDQAKASLGSSKSLVDQSGEGTEILHFMSHLNQVGQTGSTPRHPKGLATCCHGEEPHVVGWRFINERRAVNLDPNCGWAQGKADVLYVADAFKVMEQVNELLAKKVSV